MKLSLLSNESLSEDQRKLLSRDAILKEIYNEVSSITQNKNHTFRIEDKDSKHTLFTSRISNSEKQLLEIFENAEGTHPYVDYFTKSSPTTGQSRTDICNLNSLINQLCSCSNFNAVDQRQGQRMVWSDFSFRGLKDAVNSICKIDFTSDKFHLLDDLIKISLEE